jgi:hypothetical protein
VDVGEGGGETSCPVAAFTTAPEGVVTLPEVMGVAAGEIGEGVADGVVAVFAGVTALLFFGADEAVGATVAGLLGVGTAVGLLAVGTVGLTLSVGAVGTMVLGLLMVGSDTGDWNVGTVGVGAGMVGRDCALAVPSNVNTSAAAPINARTTRPHCIAASQTREHNPSDIYRSAISGSMQTDSDRARMIVWRLMDNQQLK